MRVRVLVIGIGSGDPAQLTGEAVAAMNTVDLFLVADKGEPTHDLAELRRSLCRQVIDHDHYRVVEVPDPQRRRVGGDYPDRVRDWHNRRAAAYAAVINTEVPDGGVVGFLVWGDPAWYDSTIRLAESLRGYGIDAELRVIPGISSIQLLAARHRLVLNRIGQPVHITTGRRLAAEFSPALGDVLVMLDGDLSCAGLASAHPDLQIFWAAQLGLPDEALVAGRLADVVGQIREIRARIRATRGWVLDIYLLRPGRADAGTE